MVTEPHLTEPMEEKPNYPIQLGDEWADFLTSQPETGMDYQIATVTLKDGREFRQVVISGGRITGIRNFAAAPFAAHDIASIKITHEKWDWQR